MIKFLKLFSLIMIVPVWAGADSIKDYGVQTAWNNAEANMDSASQKPGYLQLNWTPGTTLPVKLRNGMITVINLPNGEQIADAYVGSPEYFTVSKQGNDNRTLLITPSAENQGTADTNMVVVGRSGNKYMFYLRSESTNATTITHSMVDVIAEGGISGFPTGVANTGGAGTLQSAFKKNSSSYISGDEDYGWIKSIKVDPTEFRFDLDIFVPNPDDYVIAPERVWRDKIFTYIDFGDKVISMTQRPVVSLLVDGGETPVGFRTDGPNGRLMVVESIGDIVLRSGQRIVCIKKREKPFLIADTESVYALAEANVAEQYAPSLNDIYTGGQNIQMNGYDSSASYYGQPSNFVSGPVQIASPNFNGGYQSNSNQSFGLSNSTTRGSYLPNADIPIIQSNQSGVAVELASGTSVKSLNDYWTKMLVKFSSTDGAQGVLAPYADKVFFAIDEQGVGDLGDTTAGTGRLYRLRVGPISSIEDAQKLCDSLIKYQGTSCNVVRIQ